MWKTACDPLKIREDAIAPLVMKSPEGIAEELVVIHIENPEWDPDYGSWPRTFPKGLLSRAAPF